MSYHLVRAEKIAEDAGRLFRYILLNALSDLESNRSEIRMDALCWLGCPNSHLYTWLSPRFDLRISHAQVRRLVESEFPGFVLPHLENIELDTGNSSAWCHFDAGRYADDTAAYVAHLLANHASSLRCYIIARLNGVRVRAIGPGASHLEQLIYSSALLVRSPRTVGRTRPAEIRELLMFSA